jgi:hypothetical protein
MAMPCKDDESRPWQRREWKVGMGKHELSRLAQELLHFHISYPDSKYAAEWLTNLYSVAEIDAAYRELVEAGELIKQPDQGVNGSESAGHGTYAQPRPEVGRQWG